MSTSYAERSVREGPPGNVEETIVELSRQRSPTGERMIVRPYPKNNEPRTLRVSQDLLDMLAARIQHFDLGRDDLLFPSTEIAGGNPVSRNTSGPRCGCGRWRRRSSAITCGCTTCPMPTPIVAARRRCGPPDLVDRMGHSRIQTAQTYLHSQRSHCRRRHDQLATSPHHDRLGRLWGRDSPATGG